MEREYKRRRHMDKNTDTEQHLLITVFFKPIAMKPSTQIEALSYRVGSAHAEVHYEIARKPPLALTSAEKLIRKLRGFLSVGVTQCSALSIQLNSSKVEYIATTHLFYSSHVYTLNCISPRITETNTHFPYHYHCWCFSLNALIKQVGITHSESF